MWRGKLFQRYRWMAKQSRLRGLWSWLLDSHGKWWMSTVILLHPCNCMAIKRRIRVARIPISQQAICWKLTMLFRKKTKLIQFHAPPSLRYFQAYQMWRQGRIKGGGATGAIAPGPLLQGGPPWWHLIVLNKTFLWKIVVIQKKYKNTTLYSNVALSIINDFSANLTFCQF